MKTRIAIILILAAAPVVGSAVTLNQVDDFQDGTTSGWAGNTLGTVAIVGSGGPTGPGDDYLETSVTGFHLGTRNQDQWTHDYLAAGVEAIEMDLKRGESSVDPVTVRILLFGPGGTFASAQLTPPVPTGTWTHFVFGLSGNDLVYVTGGTMDLDATLRAVTTLTIRNDRPTPTPPGSHPPHITATLGIDNIHAVVRRPVVSRFSVIDGVASVDLVDLVAGVTNVLESAGTIASPTWSVRTEFIPSGISSRLSVPIESNSGCFRIRIP